MGKLSLSVLSFILLGSFANASPGLKLGYYVAVSGGGCDASILDSRPSFIEMQFPDCMGTTVGEDFDCAGKVCTSQEDSSLVLTIKGPLDFDLTNAAGVPAHYKWQKASP